VVDILVVLQKVRIRVLVWCCPSHLSSHASRLDCFTTRLFHDYWSHAPCPAHGVSRLQGVFPRIVALIVCGLLALLPEQSRERETEKGDRCV
jgi:hypothetical protein